MSKRVQHNDIWKYGLTGMCWGKVFISKFDSLKWCCLIRITREINWYKQYHLAAVRAAFFSMFNFPIWIISISQFTHGFETHRMILVCISIFHFFFLMKWILRHPVAGFLRMEETRINIGAIILNFEGSTTATIKRPHGNSRELKLHEKTLVILLRD